MCWVGTHNYSGMEGNQSVSVPLPLRLVCVMCDNNFVVAVS